MTSPSAATAAALLALLVPAKATAQATPPVLTLRRTPAVLPLDSAAARPTFRVTIPGKGTPWFVLDTGAGGSMIDSALASRYGLQVVGEAHVASPGGAGAHVPIVTADMLSIGDADIAGATLSAFPMRARGLPSDGIISYRMFATAVMTLDLSHNTLTLSHQWLTPGGPGAIQYSTANGLMQIPATVGGRTLALDIDTGNRSNITLPRSLMDSLPLKRPATPGPDVRMVSGPVHTWTAQLAGTIRVGNINVQDPEVIFIDINRANIGTGFIRQYVLTIDQSHQLVQFTKAEPERAGRLTAEMRAAVVDSLASQLRRFYFDHALGDSLGQYLKARATSGAFDNATMPEKLATLLSEELTKRVRNDPHLTVREFMY